MSRAPKDLVRASFRVIETDDRVLLKEIVHPDYINREADAADSGARGVDAFAASVDSLRASFSELRFDVKELVAENDLVVAHTVMNGRHTGPMRSLPATGKPFAQNQSHWYRVRDGLLFEHWANRDDLGFLHQVGVMPAPRVGGPPPSSTAAEHQADSVALPS